MNDIEAAKERVKRQGDRASQVAYGLIEEYGILTGKEIAELVGCSQQHMYRIAAKSGIKFATGRRPFRIREEAIAS